MVPGSKEVVVSKLGTGELWFVSSLFVLQFSAVGLVETNRTP